MALSVSVVLPLLAVVFLLIKKGGLKGGHALLCILLGFYLAGSSLAPTIRNMMTSILQSISQLHL